MLTANVRQTLRSDHTYRSPEATQGLHPLRRLWACVLLQALSDVAAKLKDDTGDNPACTRAHRAKRDARRWFASSERGVGSLWWICLQLDLSADRVRDEAKRRDSGGECVWGRAA